MKHSVKDYLKHLDDMENWKGQQKNGFLGMLKRSYRAEQSFDPF